MMSKNNKYKRLTAYRHGIYGDPEVKNRENITAAELRKTMDDMKDEEYMISIEFGDRKNEFE